jgi:ubiquitin-conjugating enzyme E2 W
LRSNLPPGVELIRAEDFAEWLMDIRVVDSNPIYAGEVYRLKFTFSPNYPIEVRLSRPLHIRRILTLLQAPEVVFVKDGDHPIPLHPHVYSNGIICLDLLDRQGWSPVHNVESVCISLQSMLTQNTKSERPPGDENFVRYNTQRPRDINFVFHDNQV